MLHTLRLLCTLRQRVGHLLAHHRRQPSDDGSQPRQEVVVSPLPAVLQFEGVRKVHEAHAHARVLAGCRTGSEQVQWLNVGRGGWAVRRNGNSIKGLGLCRCERVPKAACKLGQQGALTQINLEPRRTLYDYGFLHRLNPNHRPSPWSSQPAPWKQRSTVQLSENNE